MAGQSVEIRFPDVSADEAAALAESLADELTGSLKDEGRPVVPEIRKDNKSAQDFGATLVLVLGAPAVVVLANAIRDWARRRGVEVVVDVNGTTIKNVAGKEAAEIVKAASAKK